MNNKKIYYFVAFIIIFIIFMTQCSFAPSERIAKEILYREASLCPNCFDIVSFEKTNSITEGIHYTYYFTATIKFTKQAYASGLHYSSAFAFGELKNLRAERSLYQYFTDVIINKDEKFTIKGKIYFIKTEKGWLPSDMPMETDHVDKIN